MKKLENKVVFITGANSGIGKACAIQAAKEGAIVAVADLDFVDPTATMNEIKAISPKSIFVPIDVTNEESVKNAIETTVKILGRLDVALNNAGIGAPYSDIHDMDSAIWKKIIDVNLTGNFYSVKHELQQFLKQGGGTIVTLASLAGLVAEPGVAPYTASKHGVLGLTKNVAVQYGDKNIRANAICPYYIETPILANIDKKIQESWKDATPMKRIGTPEEVAKAFIFFASDDSSFCNGSILTIDGGKLAF